MNNKLVPALIGGVLLGVLSAIFASIPLPFVGLCCCLWSIGGGVLAVMMYVKKSPTPVSIGEGAMLGAMAGLIGGIIYAVLYTIIMSIIGLAAMEAQIKQTGVNMPVSGFALLIIAAIIQAILLLILSTIGGLIGVPIFEKRKGGGDVPPPPPPFGEQPGGGGYAGGAGMGQPGGSGYGTGA